MPAFTVPETVHERAVRARLIKGHRKKKKVSRKSRPNLKKAWAKKKKARKLARTQRMRNR